MNMARQKAKRSRHPGGATHVPFLRDTVHPHHGMASSKSYYDLNVPIPNYSPSSAEERIRARVIIQQISNRLGQTGYDTMALTHTVFGCPKAGNDDAEKAIPDDLIPKTNQESVLQRPHKRLKATRPVRIVRRLLAVVENLVDVGSFNAALAGGASSTNNTTPLHSLLRDYDLVSISPRNDGTFQAACGASEVDIVTLDYTSGRGGVQLPYRIRVADVKALVRRGAAFEVPYAAAILNVSQRKALVQTARALQLASVGVRPKPLVIVTSGDRRASTVGEDVGAMALRTPGDLINFLGTVLGFDPSMARHSINESAARILKRGETRRVNRLGGSDEVTLIVGDEEANTGGASSDIAKMKPVEKSDATPGGIVDGEQADNGLEDGFITLS